MKKYSVSNCIGYSVFAGSLCDLHESAKTVVNTINQYSYCMAEKDAKFQKALKASDILLPDGIGIVTASWFLYGKKIRKMGGADLHKYLLEKPNKNKGSCFYMDSSRETLSKIEKRIGQEYPNIRVATYSPPYKPEFLETDNAEIRQTVNSFRPDVLFVGMTGTQTRKMEP